MGNQLAGDGGRWRARLPAMGLSSAPPPPPNSAPPPPPSSAPPQVPHSSAPPPPPSSATLPRPPSLAPPSRPSPVLPPLPPPPPPPPPRRLRSTRLPTLQTFVNISALHPWAPPPASASPTPSGASPTRCNYFSAPSSIPSPTPCGAIPPATQPQKPYMKINSFFGSFLPVIFHILPDIYNLHTGCIEKTLKLFGTPAMWAGLISSIFWVLYCIVVIKVDQNIAMLISNTINCMASFNYLISVYTHKRHTTKGYILCGLFTMGISFIFAVMHWEKNPSELAKMLSGYFVFLGVFGCNCVQIGDILFRTTERAQQIATAISLLLTFIMNSATLLITVQQYPEHNLILISSLMGVVFNVIEIVLLLVVAIISHFLRSARNTSADIEAGSRAVPSGNGSSVTTSERNELVPYGGIQEQASVRQWGLRTRATHGYQQDAAYIIILSQHGARGCEIFTFRPMAHRNVYTRVTLSAPMRLTIIPVGCDINIPILLQASALFGAEHFTLIRQLEHQWRVRPSLFHRRALTDGQRAGTSPTQDNNHQEENTCVIVFEWITGEIITTRITVHYALIRAVFQQIIRRVRVLVQGVTYMVQLFEMNVAGQYIFLIRLLRVPVPPSSRWASSDIFYQNHENPSRFVELDANCSVETG